jgi:hypothetical protein
MSSANILWDWNYHIENGYYIFMSSATWNGPLHTNTTRGQCQNNKIKKKNC